MENNQMKLTPDEINSILKIINCLSNYYETRDENYDKENCALNKVFNDKEFQNSDVSWWEQKINNKPYYNQKAHIIMHLLSKTHLSNQGSGISNKGFIYLLEYHICNNRGNSPIKKTLKLKEFFQENSDKIEKLKSYEIETKNILTLLSYLELYFSEISNFEQYFDKIDYPNLNEPILNNLYNWYLKDITNPNEINTYCNKLENIVNNMEKSLMKHNENALHRYNLICTICKTKDIITKLKISYYNSKLEIYKAKNELINDSLNDFIEKYNPLK